MTGPDGEYDVIVIGAGVGGLTVSTLMAQSGMKVLVLEQNDRVGGRALSIQGSEISRKGLSWYRELLATQYTRLAGSWPDMETIISKKMLDGYTLDVGYHAISANGVGYMLDFEERIGGLPGVKKHGGYWASWYKGEIYRDVAGRFVDPRLRELAEKEKIPFLDYYTDPHRLSDGEIDELETVSLKEWADRKGITRNDILYNHLHAVSTLFSTINNPEDISMGDIFRYFKHAFGTKTARGLTRYNGGFVEGGIMAWSEAVAEKFKAFGGHIRLAAKVTRVEVEKGAVTGIRATDPHGRENRWACRRVVSNIPAQNTFRVIPETCFPEDWVRRTRNMYGYGSYTPYMGLSRLAMPEEEARLGLKNTCVLPREAGFDHDVYICWNIQSAVDPSCAPAGKHLYTAYLPMTEKEALNRKLVNKLMLRLPDFMEEIYPGFKESVDWRLDPVCRRLEGVAKSISQSGTRKVPVKSEHVEGLFFAGDTARGYGVAMDCAVISGMICAEAVTGERFSGPQ